MNRTASHRVGLRQEFAVLGERGRAELGFPLGFDAGGDLADDDGYGPAARGEPDVEGQVVAREKRDRATISDRHATDAVELALKDPAVVAEPLRLVPRATRNGIATRARALPMSLVSSMISTATRQGSSGAELRQAGRAALAVRFGSAEW
jgi:hypothetical protein